MFERMNDQFGGLDQRSLPATQSVSIDLADNEDSFEVTADLPGYDREDIDLSVADRTLRISAERDESTEESDEDGNYLRRERHRQSVSRSLSLPDDVEEDDASAAYTNGVLTVTLPKATSDSDSRSIDIS